MKIAITTSSFGKFSPKPLELLKEKNIELVLNPHGRALKPEETEAILAGCTGVVAGTEKYTREIMQSLPELKIISRCGAGMDSIDLQAAKELGITIINTPDAPTQAVAELVLGMALNLVRRISIQDRDIRAGKWKKQMGGLVTALKVGIVGMGRIGRAVECKFSALGATCAYSDPYVENGPCKQMEFEDLLAWADLISIHVPGNVDGKALIDNTRIGLLKNGAYLINCSRGGVVDEISLFARLKDGSLSGAGLDVFQEEPYHGPLNTLDNVILTPHIGSYARESRIEMEVESVKNLLSNLIF